MAEQQMISAFASSSNSSSLVSSKKYDVFLSFQGEDTRMNFTSHLHEALKQKKIETYIDYRLEKGDEISPALIKAIEDSHVSVVILSKNYASSKWCLEELSKIMEYTKNQGHIVIPVFYNVDPSHVRKQTGSYKKAFGKHMGEPRCNKWKATLTEVANLAGWDSRNTTESKLLKDIIGDILQKLTPRYPNQLKGLVGIEEKCGQIESLLKIGSSDVRTLGIWGMGGIGKTTLATALYAKLSPEFEVSCFLANVRENSSRHGGLEALRNKLFSKLLENENHCFDAPFLVPNFFMRRLGRKKVFIVLDDVTTFQQLEYLIKDYDLLGPGSRVIVTTRDKQIFRLVDEVYEVKELSFHQSLQLFCLTVFEENQPKHGYEDLSRNAISYCKGIPMALKVLSASLHRRSKEASESKLRKLQEMPNTEIHNVLKLSYDGLDCSEQDIFLDIACFLKGEARDLVTSLLEACGFIAADGIEVLLDRALITISDYNQIEMHDLIQQMGWEIVRQESIKDLGRRSRLWKPEEVCEVLKYNKGTDAVEGIILNLDTLTGNLCLSSDSLAKMTNLRFLNIYRMHSNGRFNLYLPNGLKSLSDKLRYLRWDGFYLDSLPSNFCAKQLVKLHMSDSKVKKLWDGVQNLVNLKEIKLRMSPNLIEIPDLSKAKKLESVSLVECESLCQLHPSMSSLPKLTYLNLCHCRGIESLTILSKSLCKLWLSGCSSLKEFSVTSEEMTQLHVSYTPIRALPLSIWHKRKLTYLLLGDCKNVGKLSDDPGMESITSPNHSGCTQHNAPNLSFFQEHFHNIGNLLSLEKLYLVTINVESLPANIKNLSLLRELWLENCSKLISLPELPPSRIKLRLYYCSNLMALLELPPSLIKLHLIDCSKLMSLPELPPCLRELHLTDCSKLMSLPELPPSLSQLRLYYCSKLVSLPELPPSLITLHLIDCRKLVSLPELPPYLRGLDLQDCRKLVSLPELPPSLEVLNAVNFTCMKTNIIQRLVLQHMLQNIPYIDGRRMYFIFLGEQVTVKCGFRTTGSSITIPHFPLSDLYGFIYCIILPKGLYSEIGGVSCSICQDGKEIVRNWNYIHPRKLISDHVIFWYDERPQYLSSDKPFKFEFYYCDYRIPKCSIERMKKGGVFPIYASKLGLKVFGSSSKEIFESESIIDQITDNES